MKGLFWDKNFENFPTVDFVYNYSIIMVYFNGSLSLGFR